MNPIRSTPKVSLSSWTGVVGAGGRAPVELMVSAKDWLALEEGGQDSNRALLPALVFLSL